MTDKAKMLADLQATMKAAGIPVEESETTLREKIDRMRLVARIGLPYQILLMSLLMILRDKPAESMA